MNNIKLELMYDGTDYHGFQRQKNGITIQEALEEAVRRACGEHGGIIGCSRTDAGVHASMYVASFSSDTKIPEEKIPYALNSVLPDDIRITKAEYVPMDFNARKHATQKTYVYTICNRPHNDVFLKRYSWFFPYKLNIDDMRDAAKHFQGSHDFSAFMASGGSAKTFVRNMYDIRVEDAGEGIIKIYATANGFLYNMVRIIAGTLVCVGAGRIKSSDIPDIISSCDRKRAGITAPPQGLMLTDVRY